MDSTADRAIRKSRTLILPNFFIYSNILSAIHPGERVVLVMGQGHEYLLREFVRLNPTLIDVNPLQYLK